MNLLDLSYNVELASKKWGIYIEKKKQIWKSWGLNVKNLPVRTYTPAASIIPGGKKREKETKKKR